MFIIKVQYHRFVGHKMWVCSILYLQIPEPDVSILGIDIDPDGAYLAAVNSKVHSCVLYLTLWSELPLASTGDVLRVESLQWSGD